MSGRLANSLAVLVLLVPTAPRGEAADQPEVRTWTDSSGRHNEVVARTLLAQNRQTVVELNLTNAETAENAQTPDAAVLDIVATGAGTDLEQAQQNALSSAIEQAVGVLVDAETQVKNDRILRDEVLTVSRGYIEEFKEVSQWQKDGLTYVRIRAKVSPTKLGEKLQAHGVVMAVLPGNLIAAQLRHEIDSELDAQAMFRKIVADLSPEKLIVVEVPEKAPKVEREGSTARLTVGFRLNVDMQAWDEIHTGLKPLLTKVAFRRSQAVHVAGSGWQHAEDAWKGFDRNTMFGLQLFRESTPEITTTYWDFYQLPDALRREVQALASRPRAYELSVDLLDADEQIIVGSKPALSTFGIHFVVDTAGSQRGEYKGCFVFPLLYDNGRFHRSRDCEQTIVLDIDQLARVKKYAVGIRPADQK